MERNRWSGGLFVTLVGALCLASPTASGQAWPSKPVRVVVPSTAGGNLDVITRSLMQKVSEDIGQTVVVENRPSASLILGTRFVAQSAPDGYTFLANSNTTVTAPHIVSDVGYNPVRDFTAVGLMARVPIVWVADPKLPVRTSLDAIKLLKDNPKPLSFGTAGSGSSAHIAAEMLFAEIGVRTILVPYKGNAPGLTDVAGGRVSFMFDQITSSLPFIQGGRLRILAVAGKARASIFPDIPTMAESGLPDYDLDTFNGIAAPAGTPRPIINRMFEALRKAVATPELRKSYAAQGVELTASRSPEEFDEYLRREYDRYGKLAKSANIKAD